jgi:hypothetical protein
LFQNTDGEGLFGFIRIWVYYRPVTFVCMDQSEAENMVYMVFHMLTAEDAKKG